MNDKITKHASTIPVNLLSFIFILIKYIFIIYYSSNKCSLITLNRGLGIGDWGLGIGPNPQSPIPNPQSPIPISKELLYKNYITSYNKIFYQLFNLMDSDKVLSIDDKKTSSYTNKEND